MFACISLFVLGIVNVSAQTYGDLSYSIENGSVTITGCKETATNIVIPEKIENCPVTSIGEGAFSECSSLTSITIPDSVTHIGYHAFENCSSLISVTIPDSVIYIGRFAFDGCSSLISITIPDSVKYIGACAFDKTGYYNDNSNWENGVLYIGNFLIEAREYYFDDYYLLGNYVIKSGTKAICDGAFINCSSLTSITIPNGVTKIGYNTFFRCDHLTSITIPNSVTTIDDGAFYQCNALATVYYNGTEDDWNKININSFDNESLTNATRQYFWYVTVIDEDGELIIKKRYDIDSLIDISDIKNSLGYTPVGYMPVLYTDENLTKEFDLSTPITKNITLYMAAPKLKTAYMRALGGEKILAVTPINLPIDTKIIIACYKGKKLVDIKFTENKNETIYSVSNADFDSAKIMAWDSFKSMIPLCEYAPIALNQ